MRRKLRWIGETADLASNLPSLSLPISSCKATFFASIPQNQEK